MDKLDVPYNPTAYFDLSIMAERVHANIMMDSVSYDSIFKVLHYTYLEIWVSNYDKIISEGKGSFTDASYNLISMACISKLKEHLTNYLEESHAKDKSHKDAYRYTMMNLIKNTINTIVI
jgi:hypothetical protein